jgi:hypothetical protein
LDSILSIVEQIQWKKNYRAKRAKLAKASPPPIFFKLYLGVPFDLAQDMLGVPFVVAQDMLCARYNFFLSFRRRKNSNIFG